MANQCTLRWQSAIRSRCAILMKMYDSLRVRIPFVVAMPNVPDLALLYSARSLILDTPYETMVTLGDLTEVFEQLLGFLSSWFVVADEVILDIVRNSSIGRDATHSTLPLAATLFNCSTCSRTLHYPRVLVHSCLQIAVPNNVDEPENLAHTFPCLKCRPWNWATKQTQITFDESAHKHMKALLALYHFQPVPSYDVLQDIDPFVECLTTVSSAALKYEREVVRMTMAVTILIVLSMACSWRRRPGTSGGGRAIIKCFGSLLSCPWCRVTRVDSKLLPALRRKIVRAL